MGEILGYTLDVLNAYKILIGKSGRIRPSGGPLQSLIIGMLVLNIYRIIVT
jgi:hypothetical protein